MIRTLYVRIGVVIFIVVWGSLVLSSMMFSYHFRGQVHREFEERLTNSSVPIVKMLQTANEDTIVALTELAFQMNRGQNLRLYNGSGQQLADYVRNTCTEIPPEAVETVLDGFRYSDFSKKDEEGCPRGIVGISFQADGKPYALFLTPDVGPQIRSFDRLQTRNLWTILAISGIVIVIAAIYLVRPLKQITVATRRISKGDFDVRLNIKQRDELGELAGSINHMAEELKKMEKMRQEFVTNVSHDIQTPLTSIRGFSKLLQNDTLDPEERIGYLKLIESESERLSRLSENLLKLASLESEHHPFHPVRLQLDEQLRLCVVSCEPLWSSKKLSIELDLASVSIVADEDSLNQVWMNLLHNAIKFTPEGGTITISLERQEDGALVRISDTGIGIAPEELANVFRRFYKTDASRQSSGWKSGSGLGLSIVKKIVDLHHGEIQVASRLEKGTTFSVKLPSRK
ncbi:sensor histidine kinase [Paenibacillus turpanensis]|uniref:sensor histidine kinase n=1 Tax=Paenibacillus turpanensis TaxID=2689078 RepID=UPI001409512A|nr:HAMP domain-containing sensor histidine kinase [Paenibacillus turpanensis]